jgi:hypothetical protein
VRVVHVFDITAVRCIGTPRAPTEGAGHDRR